MSRCCAGDCCDCYERGYDDGLTEGSDDFDALNCALDKCVVNLKEDVKVWPTADGYVARVYIDLPEGHGKTEKEAIGDLVLKLIDYKLTLVAMNRF